MSTSWPWHPGASLLSGQKYSSYHLCRLLGQIGWHASTFLHQHIFWHAQWDKSINKINMATADLYTENVIAVTEADLMDEQK